MRYVLCALFALTSACAKQASSDPATLVCAAPFVQPYEVVVAGVGHKSEIAECEGGVYKISSLLDGSVSYSPTAPLVEHLANDNVTFIVETFTPPAL
jgi:hypothetical protein